MRRICVSVDTKGREKRGGAVRAETLSIFQAYDTKHIEDIELYIRLRLYTDITTPQLSSTIEIHEFSYKIYINTTDYP